MDLILLTITTITLIIIFVAIMLVNNYIKIKNESVRTINNICDSAIHSLIFNDKYRTGNDENIIKDMVHNMSFQISSNEEAFDIADIAYENDEQMIKFTVLKPYKWFTLKKYAQVNKSIDVCRIGLGNYSEKIIKDEITEEMKTATFIVDHEMYTQLRLSVGEQIELPTMPLKPKYKFTGWYVEGDLDKEIITKEEWETFRIADNITFIAQFKAKY